MKHKQVFSMNLTGPIDYGFRNDYNFSPNNQSTEHLW